MEQASDDSQHIRTSDRTVRAGGPQPSGWIELRWENGRTVLYLHGEIDNAAVNAFEADTGQPGLPRPAATSGVDVVDAAAVTFINSTGIGLLVRVTEDLRRAGRRPELRRPAQPVRRILQVTGLDQLFERSDG